MNDSIIFRWKNDEDRGGRVKRSNQSWSTHAYMRAYIHTPRHGIIIIIICCCCCRTTIRGANTWLFYCLQLLFIIICCCCCRCCCCCCCVCFFLKSTSVASSRTVPLCTSTKVVRARQAAPGGRGGRAGGPRLVLVFQRAGSTRVRFQHTTLSRAQMHNTPHTYIHTYIHSYIHTHIAHTYMHGRARSAFVTTRGGAMHRHHHRRRRRRRRCSVPPRRSEGRRRTWSWVSPVAGTPHARTHERPRTQCTRCWEF